MPLNVRTWYVIAAVSPALLALVTVAAKSAITYVSQDWFLCFMFIFTLPFLAPWGAGFRGCLPPRAARLDFLGHTICIGTAWGIYTAGIALLPAAVAVFVSRLEGIFIIILAVIFLRERFSRLLVLAAVLSFAGIALIDQGEIRIEVVAQSRLGIVLVAGGALAFAAGEIFAMRALRYMEPRPLTFLRNTVLSGVFFLIALRNGTMLTFSGLVGGCLWILTAAVAGPVLARVIHLHCIKHIPLSHAAVMTNTEPVFGVLLGLLVFSEMPTAYQHVGAVLILAGVGLGFFQRRSTSDCTENCPPKSCQTHHVTYSDRPAVVLSRPD